MNIFNELTVINFESGNIDYSEMRKQWIGKFTSEQQYEIYANSKIYYIWRKLNYFSPNITTLDRILSKLISGYFSIKFGRYDLTFYGYNAMQWAITLGTPYTYWHFQPPHYSLMGIKGFTWGSLYQSPNATPWHPEAIIYYGREKND